MKVVSIKENSDFKRLYYRGKSEVKKNIALYYRKNRFSYNRLGITVSPKVGKAVIRNRVKRLLKENYRIKIQEPEIQTQIRVQVAKVLANIKDNSAVNPI